MKRTLTALAACMAGPAFGQGQCAPFDYVLDHLSEQYGEEVFATAQRLDGSQILFFGNGETGTFTVMAERNGNLCVITAGEGMDTKSFLHLFKSGVPI